MVTRLENMTRDQLCMALADLFGYSEYEWDGQTFPEIWEYLSDAQQAQVEAYLLEG